MGEKKKKEGGTDQSDPTADKTQQITQHHHTPTSHKRHLWAQLEIIRPQRQVVVPPNMRAVIYEECVPRSTDDGEGHEQREEGNGLAN